MLQVQVVSAMNTLQELCYLTGRDGGLVTVPIDNTPMWLGWGNEREREGGGMLTFE